MKVRKWKMKMIQLYNDIKLLNKPLIENPSEVLIAMNYNNASSTLDRRYLSNIYRDLTVNPCLYDSKYILDYEWLQVMISGLLISNDYKYKKLKQTIDYNYDYDKNYNRTKKVTTTDSFGQQKTTTVNGVSITSTQDGERTNTNTIKKAGYDTSASSSNPFVNDTQEINLMSGGTSTIKTDSKTDSANSDAYEDTHVTEETEYGDLSVRTVGEMLEKERQIAYFSFYDVLYRDIINEIGVYIFE